MDINKEIILGVTKALVYIVIGVTIGLYIQVVGNNDMASKASMLEQQLVSTREETAHILNKMGCVEVAEDYSCITEHEFYSVDGVRKGK